MYSNFIYIFCKNIKIVYLLTAENGAYQPSPNGKIHPKFCTIGVKTA